MIFRQKFKPPSSIYEPSFVKELRDPHCRCNLRAIVSQELLFNLEPFKKVGRRHTQMYASKGIVCLLNTRVSKAAFFSPPAEQQQQQLYNI